MKTPEHALSRARVPSRWLALLEARVALDVAAMGVAMLRDSVTPARPASPDRPPCLAHHRQRADDT